MAPSWFSYCNGNCTSTEREKPGTQEKRGQFTIKRTIKEQPQEVEDREVFGHWELDTRVSSRGQSKGYLATFVKRKNRFYIAVKWGTELRILCF